MVNNILGKSKVYYSVTTLADFRETLDGFYGGDADQNTIGDLLLDLDADEEADAVG